MGDYEQFEIILKGPKVWNEWRKNHLNQKIDLSDILFLGANLNGVNLKEANLFRANLKGSDFMGADLSGASFTEASLSGCNFAEAMLSDASFIRADLSESNFTRANLAEAKLWGATLSRADLYRAYFYRANLKKANLSKTNLTEADFTEADLERADLSGAVLTGADLTGADLSGADLTGTNLTGANLQFTSLVLCKIEQATLTNCKIFGISAWAIKGIPKEQHNLLITSNHEVEVTVDNFQVAQFIYLLLNNNNVRNIIDTITSKVVLILGRFSDERKAVLDAIREKLRTMNLTPIVFDFDKPASKDTTGTVETLARMARFIIADLTDPSSIPHELASIVPHLRTTPIQLIKLEGAAGYSMINDYIGSYKWLLGPHIYSDIASLIDDLAEVIRPADKMAEEFSRR
jgi:uncharacterized protein YjbI with pentapeptide repeats